MDITDLVKNQKDRRTATQDNELIESCYSMTLNEKRLLFLGIAKLDPRKFPNESEPACFTVTAKEFGDNFSDTDNPWRTLKRAAKKLRPRYVKLHPKSRAIEKEINWFDSMEYSSASSSVTARFSWSIHTRLAGMSGNFTPIPLSEVKPLRSIYGIRLFEMLRQYKPQGYRKISIADYRFSLDCVEKYKTIGELKRNTLIPGLNDIKKNTSLKVIFRDVKEGRNITHFEFIIN